jgi:hypothetical protein
MISPRFIYRRRNKSLDGWNRSGDSGLCAQPTHCSGVGRYHHRRWRRQSRAPGASLQRRVLCCGKSLWEYGTHTLRTVSLAYCAGDWHALKDDIQNCRIARRDCSPQTRDHVALWTSLGSSPGSCTQLTGVCSSHYPRPDAGTTCATRSGRSTSNLCTAQLHVVDLIKGSSDPDSNHGLTCRASQAADAAIDP